MSRLNGRVRALERRDRLAAGCPSCGRQPFHILEPDEAIPSWLDASCCRGCGVGVKLIDCEAWDQL
jgi:hypothetical protein